MSAEAFCRLQEPKLYVPCQWNLAQDAEARAYFLTFFREQYDRTLKLAVTAAGDTKEAVTAAEECRRKFHVFLDQLAAGPEKYGRPTILSVDYIRDNLLREAGFADPYALVKQRDNAQALPLLPGVCADLKHMQGEELLHGVISGALAGNIFDMGVTATAKRMMEANLCFLHTRDNLPQRPWLVDDFTALSRRICQGRPHRQAVIFVDNAGADFCLGMLPLARFLAQRGTRVLLVGNELPTLNDMTIHDMRSIWPEVLAKEPSFQGLPIELISSGTGEPLLDLGRISPALNKAAAKADLVILEGMGRALESNFFARFACDVLKIAMIKDQFVANRFGGKLYDVVCRFEAGRD